MATPADQLAAEVAKAAAAWLAERTDGDGGVAYSIDEIVVVVLHEATAEFRLRADVAAAAARTPGATMSSRGPEWVAFSPTTFDRFTRDRIEAWFEFAVRQVGH